jgi:hypothetical protein
MSIGSRSVATAIGASRRPARWSAAARLADRRQYGHRGRHRQERGLLLLKPTPPVAPAMSVGCCPRRGRWRPRTARSPGPDSRRDDRARPHPIASRDILDAAAPYKSKASDSTWWTASASIPRRRRVSPRGRRIVIDAQVVERRRGIWGERLGSSRSSYRWTRSPCGTARRIREVLAGMVRA